MLSVLLALPSWMKVAVVSIALVGAVHVRHWFIERGLHAELAAVTQQRDDALIANAELRAGIADAQANRDMWVSRAREQSRAIELLQARAKASDTAAALAAARALAAGREASAALRTPASTVPPGHAAMNAWLQAEFGAAR